MGKQEDCVGGPAMKFCYKCWSKVPADAGFCEVCGAIFQDKDEKYVPDPNPVRSFEEAPIKIKKPSKMWAVIPVALVVFVAAILLIFSGVFTPEPEEAGIPYVELSHEWSDDGNILYVTVEINNSTQNPIRGSYIICDALIGSGSYVGTFIIAPSDILSPGDSCKCSLKFDVLSKDAYAHYRLAFTYAR